MDVINLSEKIYNYAIQCGFDNCGIISVNMLDEFKQLLRKRVSNVPESKVFYENVGSLQDIRKRFPWAKSIVILTFNYGKYRFPKELQGKYAKAFFLSPSKSYMTGFDLDRFEQWFTEHGIRAEGGEHIGIGPLRYMAAKVGLGIIRKNNVCPHNRKHDWSSGECFPNLAEIAPMIQPQEYEHLSDEFLIEQVISRTADHLQASDVQALRKNANRAYSYCKITQSD